MTLDVTHVLEELIRIFTTRLHVKIVQLTHIPDRLDQSAKHSVKVSISLPDFM